MKIQKMIKVMHDNGIKEATLIVDEFTFNIIKTNIQDIFICDATVQCKGGEILSDGLIGLMAYGVKVIFKNQEQ